MTDTEFPTQFTHVNEFWISSNKVMEEISWVCFYWQGEDDEPIGQLYV